MALRSLRVWSQGTREEGEGASWQPDDCTQRTPKGLPWLGGLKKISRVGRRHRLSRLPRALGIFAWPQRNGIPRGGRVFSLSPIPRGARRTPQASAPFSAPLAHLRTLLSLFIFLTLSASFSSFILFLGAPASHPRRLLLFPPPSVPPQSLPSSASLSPSPFFPSSRTRLVISNKS